MIRRFYRYLTTTAATLALTTALAGPVTAQGVPTVDTQNIAQEIRQLQQMLQDFGIQTDLLDNALEQLDMLQSQLDQLGTVLFTLIKVIKEKIHIGMFEVERGLLHFILVEHIAIGHSALGTFGPY